MLSKRHKEETTQDGKGSAFWSVSTSLMILLAACFGVQQVVVVQMEKPYDVYVALSGYGMKSGHLWELFTYQLVHQGVVHLLVNLAGLWFLGRTAEARWGARHFLLVYLGAVLTGAVLQGGMALSGFLLPESMETTAAFLRDRFGEAAAGSSVGLCGVFAAFCRQQSPSTPWQIFRLVIRPAWLLAAVLVAAVALVIIPTDPKFAHLAHLGGLLFGVACGGRIVRGKPMSATSPDTEGLS